MAEPIRVAALQMCSGTEPDKNLDALERLVEEAARDGASYVLSPEVTVAFAENREGLRRVAGSAEGNGAIERASSLARKHGVFLHLGSMAVALEDGRFANRSLLFSPDGALSASYDKIHLFDATLPGVREYRESATYRGGDKAVVVPAAGFNLGLTICYDVRFPQLFSVLGRAGAEVIAVPAAFTVPTGQAHWEILLRARAIETGAFVIAAAQGGQHQNGRSTYGHSMIISPWGEVLAHVDHDHPCIVLADIDIAQVQDARARVPALQNAREFALDVRLG